MASSSDWNNLIADLPGAHILQTSDWGALKARFGWTPTCNLWLSQGEKVSKAIFSQEKIYHADQIRAAAMVLTRTINLPGFKLKVVYVPKGPLLDWGDLSLRRQVLEDLKIDSKRQGALFVKIDPDVDIGKGVPGQAYCEDDPLGLAFQTELQQTGWHFSDEQIQFKNSMLIDLKRSDEELLAAMKPKTRYNVRLAERKGVTIRSGTREEIPLLYQMYAETSIRDGFVIRSQDYYQSVWGEFLKEGLAEALIAEVEGEVVAGLLLFTFGTTAWYLYGMSTQSQRDKMPNYLLQWEAIRRARQHGCAVYDLWGAPDTFSEDDPMWGVYRFKDGLGATVVRRLGAWDFPLRPTFYPLYTRTLPKILNLMRRHGNQQTRRQLGA